MSRKSRLKDRKGPEQPEPSPLEPTTELNQSPTAEENLESNGPYTGRLENQFSEDSPRFR